MAPRTMVIFFVFVVSANQLYNTVFPSQINAAHQATEKQHPEFVKIDNLVQLNQTVAEANQQGKTVMLDLYADWCIACKEFEEYTFPEPQVQSALENTVMVQIDLTDTGSDSSIELMEHFDVFGLPSILFFDINGQEVSNKRVTGFMGADEFASHVNGTFNH